MKIKYISVYILSLFLNNFVNCADSNKVDQIRNALSAHLFPEADKILAENSSLINQVCSNGRLLLNLFSMIDYRDLVLYLLTKGADPNAQDKELKTAVHSALFAKSTEDKIIEILELLISFNANVNMVDDRGATPLLIASSKGYLKVFERLLEAGAIFTSDTMNFTCLMQATMSGHLNIMRRLINGFKVDVNRTTIEDGSTPLMLAVLKNQEKSVELLLTAGADKDAKNRLQQTPLMLAALNGFCNIAKKLIDAGADVNAQDIAGGTALSAASLKGHSDIVDLLLENNCNPNFQDNIGRSALIAASNGGHANIVRKLLLNGAKPDLRAKSGLCAFDFAKRKAFADVIEVFREYYNKCL